MTGPWRMAGALASGPLNTATLWGMLASWLEKWIVTLGDEAVSFIGLNAMAFAESWRAAPGPPGVPPGLPAPTVTVPNLWAGGTPQWKKALPGLDGAVNVKVAAAGPG